MRAAMKCSPTCSSPRQIRWISPLDTIDTAIALDPLTPGNFHAKATFMMMRGNYPEAIKLDSRALN